MEAFDWESRIREWSRKRIEYLIELEQEELPPEIMELGYLAYAGAIEEQIVAAEVRLGVTFPPSYRQFLKVSNGLRSTSDYGIHFYSTEEVEWHIVGYEEIVDYFMEPEQKPVTDEEYFVYGEEQCDLVFRPEYLDTAIEISSEDEKSIFLLNPQIITQDDEWEAFFRSCIPPFSINRYRSFREMMEQIIFNAPEFPI
ncbi:MAG: SMI1/KNR4 family protein [Microcoleus sp. PH2017_10_PVI_O_A]|uniref:SMI1/KNR4 family protein n=1 Tax=unclassified Microcoleus TaxID=2642155 RepID=UPI001E0EE8C7|nr:MULTISPECIES: SMI1/KNR4 family protein [unclassified Microcoleus]TAE82549.1 MAG: SMI1/KNR4 family protein [Oscillatoriales cyanobacterium]MCC3406636.1 SMI1/KNR4 family protein [Microcoleus sp. PH2017_10_PVI_O_A]MCC3460648.1 SMI1/KNR4 family protein [Microcoleus sp. PH2017_11_PCY_U_A]MCC3479195.1 SMI1/KNR4 family protein [Microcoleus sp. PH2017_12_PCY_D_A]MCC3560036.1 SMI1/KNR4 family protein [Microcoleus sp. PH2017_27_LUM_O_A]